MPHPMPPGEVTRRDFVGMLGASAALAGLVGCTREPREEILPYVDTALDALPGTARQYATAMTIDGYATGLLVTTRDGRPLKIEGNPLHPSSHGAAGVMHQASILQLYDPDRARTCRIGPRDVRWEALLAALRPDQLLPRVGARGVGLSFLLEPTSSPLHVAMIDAVRTRYPECSVHYFAALGHEQVVRGCQLAFGRAAIPYHDLSRADVIVSLGADFLAAGPDHLHLAHDWSVRQARDPKPLLFVAEPVPTPTGTVAGDRVAATTAQLLQIALRLLDAAAPAAAAPVPATGLPQPLQSWCDRLAGQLQRNAVIIASPQLPASLHAAVAALNRQLDPDGTRTRYIAPPILDAGGRAHDLTDFANQLAAGQVDTLVVAAANPVYAAPGDVRLGTLMRQIPTRLYLGEYVDETAAVATHFANASHYLEAWGDSRSYDGSVLPAQPMIAPLHDGHSAAELLSAIAGDPASGRELLQRHCPDSIARDALRTGLVRGVVPQRLAVTPNIPGVREALAATVPATGTVLQLIPGHGVHDGRFAGNAWLQELPDPVTKLTWDNAAMVSPAFAAELGVASGDLLSLHLGDQLVELPALATPGMADQVVAIALGYGRRGEGILTRPIGVNVNPLRASASEFETAHVIVTRTGRRMDLAITQAHWSIEGRGDDLVDGHIPSPPATLYPPRRPAPDGFGRDQWAMTIDLARCTGCSACVVACQAENNVPVVGRTGVLQSREMHWLRIDRYIDETPGGARFTNQPMLCQHCEHAPCEYVCPVNATVHSDDGLNEMVYNRCVGTRFCSNNCPYKVRRFNWFDYTSKVSEFTLMQRNPQVTVRDRGVMEKCTFCVQRIRGAQSDAQIAGRDRTGAVQTACQQTCPTQAIQFGSLTDPDSGMTSRFADPRSFSALGALNTAPRVRYFRRHDPESPA
jgi:Fe-S-cluster-containing dehydrogenase component